MSGLCKDFSKGGCFRGAACPFSHISASALSDAAGGRVGGMKFVKTAVLTADETGEFNKETEVPKEEREEEAEHPDLKKLDSRDNRSLYEQLQAKRDEKEKAFQDEFKAAQGMKLLDEEEVEHLDSILEAKARRDLRRKTQEDEDIKNFLKAKEGAVVKTPAIDKYEKLRAGMGIGLSTAIDSSKTAAAAAPPSSTTLKPKFKIKAKRKVEDSTVGISDAPTGTKKPKKSAPDS